MKHPKWHNRKGREKIWMLMLSAAGGCCSVYLKQVRSAMSFSSDILIEGGCYAIPIRNNNHLYWLCFHRIFRCGTRSFVSIYNLYAFAHADVQTVCEFCVQTKFTGSKMYKSWANTQADSFISACHCKWIYANVSSCDDCLYHSPLSISLCCNNKTCKSCTATWVKWINGPLNRTFKSVHCAGYRCWANEFKAPNSSSSSTVRKCDGISGFFRFKCITLTFDINSSNNQQQQQQLINALHLYMYAWIYFTVEQHRFAAVVVTCKNRPYRHRWHFIFRRIDWKPNRFAFIAFGLQCVHIQLSIFNTSLHVTIFRC